MGTPQSGTIKVCIIDGNTHVIACKKINVGERITYFYGKIVRVCKENKDVDLIVPHVYGKWSLDCSISPITERPIRLLSVCRSTYPHGVAAYVRRVEYRGNCSVYSEDSEENSKVISSWHLENIDPKQRVSVLIATKYIEKGDEILQNQGIVIEEDTLVPWQIDENQPPNVIQSKHTQRGKKPLKQGI